MISHFADVGSASSVADRAAGTPVLAAATHVRPVGGLRAVSVVSADCVS